MCSAGLREENDFKNTIIIIIMKKRMLFLLLLLAVADTFALAIERDKYYTIKSYSDSLAFMADNEADDDRIECVGSETSSIYWRFIPTGNDNCYYIMNGKTKRYIQGYTGDKEKITMGTTPVEYHVKSFEEVDGRFYFAATGYSPHDFTGNTLGLNLHAESYQADCYVQSYGAVKGANPRSTWTIEEVKLYTMSKDFNGYTSYIKDTGGSGLAAESGLDNACLWRLEDAGDDKFYVRNVLTGRYAQACDTTAEQPVKMGSVPVKYKIKDCSSDEGANNYGLTSADHDNTDFTEGCIGWNLQSETHVVQSYAAQSGTNHKSFWVFTEYEPQVIGSAGYATFGSTTADAVILGAQAYKGTAGSSSISLTEVADVPKDNGVVIQGSLYAVATATASADMSGNSLKASDGSISGGEGIYALARKDGEVGFYPVASGVTIPEGKAYLDLGEASVKGFTFSFDNDDATAIRNPWVAGGMWSGGESICNLAGQRMQRLQRGINIVNGRKVMVK